MRYTIFVFLFLSFHSLVYSQDDDIVRGLVAHFSFDDCENLGRDDSGNNADATVQGDPACACGVKNGAIQLDGEDDFLLFLGTISNAFATIDFTVSLYIKPTNPLGSQDIISKRESCSVDRAFAIRYISNSNTIEAQLSQDANISATVSGQLPFEPCWFHIVFIRRSNRSLLFIDGELVQEFATPLANRVTIDNDAVLNIANGECVGITDNRFTGLIDELKVFDRALRVEEVSALNVQPDRIKNEDAIIFLGSTIDIELGETCADRFLWTPTIGIDDNRIAEPSITPISAGTFTYQVNLSDEFCTATDTVQITVIDPEDLPCEAQLPSAFTPNNDGRNDTYGISNAVVLGSKLIDFEIFDRWGGRIFFTTDPTAQWDGRFNGQELNPGVLLYRVRYFCDEEEQVDVGSLTLLR